VAAVLEVRDAGGSDGGAVWGGGYVRDWVAPCGPCLRGNCDACTDPVTEYDDLGPVRSCCCEEAVDLGPVEEG
jgi:hypothetical protein